MSDTPEALSIRLASEGQKTLAFWRELSAKQWSQLVYTEQAVWDARRVLAHFVSAEESFLKLVANIVAGGMGAPPDFDIDRYNDRHTAALSELGAEELLQRFERLRLQTSQQVAALQPEDLERVGRHPFLGEARLVEIIKLIYRHNQLHQRDLRRLLAKD